MREGYAVIKCSADRKNLLRFHAVMYLILCMDDTILKWSYKTEFFEVKEQGVL